MRKTFLVVCGMIAAASLAACGGSGQTGGDSASTSTSVTATSVTATSDVVEATSVTAGDDAGGGIVQGTAANTISEDGDYKSAVYSSSGDDENALRVDGATVTLNAIAVNKTDGDTSGQDYSDSYGLNAGLLVTNGANAEIDRAAVTTSAEGGTGIFAYGGGSAVEISESVITTTGDYSGGVRATGGALADAENLTVTTNGDFAPAISSGTGGGTVSVEDGAYTANGYDSPAVSSMSDISIDDVVLTSNNSEALVIDGGGSITLEDCYVSGNMSDSRASASDEGVQTVMIYGSGEASGQTASLSMTGGTLTSNNGDVIHVTNTDADISLNGVKIENKDTDGYLLSVTGNSAGHGWGTAGSNGANVSFNAAGQTLAGNIVVDDISTLAMTLSGGSTFTGSVNIIGNEQGGASVADNAAIVVNEGCTWTLTEDCTVSALDNKGTINYDGHTITLADGTVLS